MSTLEVKGIQAPAGFKLTMPAGHIIQTVQATYGTRVISSADTFIDTGLTGTITPSSTSNKILVTVSQMGLDKRTNNAYMYLTLLKGSTVIYTPNAQLLYTANTNGNSGSCTFSYLDSPSSTSAVTYKTQFKSVGGHAQVSVQWAVATSIITLQEVAG